MGELNVKIPSNSQLTTFENSQAKDDYIIKIEMPEFTCLCPMTQQPDFATLYLYYIPNQKCVELKSLKIYICSFRNTGAFHEKITNDMLDTLFQLTQPRFMRLVARFNVRGGIYTTISAHKQQKNWSNPDLLEKITLFNA